MSHSDIRRLKEEAVALGFAEPSMTAKHHLAWPYVGGGIVVTGTISGERQRRTARAALKRFARAAARGVRRRG